MILVFYLELISNIYERFIGKADQKSNMAFYTPLFIVDYIFSNTKKVNEIKEKSIKVLEPTCGTGIFLVEI
jgi:predicted helicase